MNHSRERFRLARLAMAVGGLERVVSTVVGAARIPLLVWGLSSRDYGLYVTILGVVATAALTDFGLSLGVVNAVSKAHGEGAPGRAREVAATGFVIYTVITAASLVATGFFAWLAPLPTLLGVAPDQGRLARTLATLGFVGILLPMPLRVVPAVMVGTQQQHVPALFRTILMPVQMGLLAFVLVAWRGALVPVAIVGAVFEPVAWLSFALWAAVYQPGAAIHLRAASTRYVRVLLGSGLLFFMTNVASLFKRTVPIVVISRALTPEGVPPFSVPMALFAIGISASDVVAVSLWPAYGEAAARGDWPWVERAFRAGSKAALTIAVLVAALGLLVGADVVAIVASKISMPPRGVFAWLALWLLTQALTSIATFPLAAMGRNRLVMWMSLGEGALTVFATSVLVRPYGVQGVAFAMMVSGATSAIFLSAYAVPRATQGRLRVDIATYARLALCGLATTGAMWPVARALAAYSPLARVLGVTGPTLICYGGLAWAFVATALERERLRQWCTLRLARART